MRTLSCDCLCRLGQAVAVALMATGPLCLHAAAGPSFNFEVRPILAEKCFACHGPDGGQRKGDLRLDDREAAVAARAIVPGQSAASEMIRRLTAADEDEVMPPPDSHKTLSEQEKEVLRRWVDAGAVYENHWAFVPPVKPPVPGTPAGMPDPPTPIDAFVQAELVAKGLKPAPPAIREEWLRRVTFGLTGLPPTLEELTTFLDDTSPEAPARVVDRLLSSPAYGERMAVDWLDAARYGDTYGRHEDNTCATWPYRDWLIRMFNANLPYDRFVAWQTAGGPRFEAWRLGHLPPGEVKPVAGFWQRLLGKTDPRAETRAILPAHHFPLDETDKESRLVRDALNPKKTGVTRNAFRPVEARFGGGLLLRDDRDNQIMFDDLGHYRRIDPFSCSLWVKSPVEHDHAVILHHTRGANDAAHRGYEFTLEEGKLAVPLAHYYPGNAIRVQAKNRVSLADWTHLGFTYDGSSRAQGVAIYVNGRRLETEVVRDRLVKDITYRREWGDYDEDLPDLEIKTEATLEVGGRYLDRTLAGATLDELKFYAEELSAAEMAQLAGQEPEGGQEAWFDWFARTQDPATKAAMAEVHEARRAEDDFVADLTELMVMREWDGPRRPTPILGRGQWDSPGELVTPGVPAAILPWPEGAPNNRLGLARWLTDPRHPLTSRVAANRYWSLLFGQGLVATPEDFGLQGARPSHPELLDWLAVWLVENNWDIKALCRMIVLSATYRQSSVPAVARYAEEDQENVWLARGPRFRLPAEQVRDAALAVSGLLVRNIGGPSVKPYQPDGLWEDSGTQHVYRQDNGEKLYRRSLYTFWRRTCPPPMLSVFDAPTREFCRVRREETLTPLQGLALMNETGFTEAARVLAERLVQAHPNPSEQQARIHEVYRRLTGRMPLETQVTALSALIDEGRLYFSSHSDEAVTLLSTTGARPPAPDLPAPEVAATFLMTRALLASDAFVSSY